MLDQLQEALEISLKGPEREAIVTSVRDQCRQWGIPLAPSAMVVLDFGLGDFSRHGLVENWIVNELQAGYCGKYLFLFAGQTCPRHRHQVKTETFFVLKGRVRMDCEGKVTEMKPGDVKTVARGKFHEFTGIENSLVLEVSQPCVVDDNYFENSAVPYGQNYRPSEERSV